MKAHWRIRQIDEDTARRMADSLGVGLPLASLLCARGIEAAVDAEHYLAPRFSATASPFLMKGMDGAVERIRRAVERDERIGIFSDSDLDGLTALTLMLRVLEKLGHKGKKDCGPFIRYPVNQEEYGLSIGVIDEFAEKGVTLVITLDSGMRDVKEVAHAEARGIDVIVCDHHEEGPERPGAVIVNPKQSGCMYPFKELAGVGVAFKLGHALLMSSLQRFGRRCVLLARDGGSLWAVPVHRRIAGAAVCLEDLSGIRSVADEADTVVLFGMEGEIRAVGDRCPGLEVLGFESMSGMTIEKACVKYGIREGAFHRRIDLAAEIYLEYDFNLSPRLKDFITSLCDLVALGTIADIMPLRGENRTLVYHGLRALAVTSHPGLDVLLRSIGGGVTSKVVSWTITPLLNTPGRFGMAGLTADLFLEEDTGRLASTLKRIQDLNAERKNLMNGLFETYLAEVRSGRHRYGKDLVFIDDGDIPEGLCGLLANRLADSLNRPVIVVSLAGGKRSVKGSGRAKGNFNFMAKVVPLSGLLEKFGGHAPAFGFSIDRGRLPEMKERLAAALDAESRRHGEEELLIDLEMPVENITVSMIKGFAAMEPFGCRNEEPVFMSRGVRVRDFQRFGAEKNHGKYFLAGNGTAEVIGWNMADVMEMKAGKGPVDIVYRLENSSFNGNVTPRMMLVDVD